MAENKQNWFARHKFLTVILVIIAIGVVATAFSSSDEPQKVEDGTNTDSAVNAPGSGDVAEEQTKFHAGDVIAFDGKEVTVSEATRNWDSGNEFLKPDSGKEWIKVEVTIENKSDSTASYNTFDWKLQDSDGVIKDVDAVAYSVDGALNSGELAPGGKVSGFLVFAVPQDDTGLKLQYSPSFWTDKKVEIEL
jgi:hypothetical protein